MGIALNQSEDVSQVVLEGAVDIALAAELKETLVKAIASAKTGKKIDVSVEAATTLDVTAYQLLWAAAREACCAGAVWTLAGEVPEPARTAFAEIGLDAAALKR